MILYPGIFWPTMLALQTAPRTLLTMAAVGLGCGMVVGCLALRWRCWVPPRWRGCRPSRGPQGTK